MTYDIYCYRPTSKLPSVEEARAVLEGPARQDTEAREGAGRVWRIVEALMQCNPRLEPFGFDFSKVAGSKEAQEKILGAELNTPVGELSLQISVSADEAGITIPYWYEGAEADQVFSIASAYLRILGRTGGFFVYDPQIELAFDPLKDELNGLNLYKMMTRRLPGMVNDIKKGESAQSTS